MTPQHLGGEVGRSRLGRHPCRLDDPFQDDDELKEAPVQVIGGDLPEGAVARDAVLDDDGPDEEEAPVPRGVPEGQLALIVRQVLALLRLALADEDRAHLKGKRSEGQQMNSNGHNINYCNCHGKEDKKYICKTDDKLQHKCGISDCLNHHQRRLSANANKNITCVASPEILL